LTGFPVNAENLVNVKQMQISHKHAQLLANLAM